MKKRLASTSFSATSPLSPKLQILCQKYTIDYSSYESEESVLMALCDAYQASVGITNFT